MRDFQRLLLSDDNSVIDPAHLRVHQDMTKPLSHYLVHSSHNTYLTGNQLSSDSSADMYRRVLCMGCRCIEIDVFDGPEEPLVYHKFTATSRVSLRQVLEAINERLPPRTTNAADDGGTGGRGGGRGAGGGGAGGGGRRGGEGGSGGTTAQTDYPVILSFENHCTVEQQGDGVDDGVDLRRQAAAPLSPQLASGVPANDSPEALREKIIVKGSGRPKTPKPHLRRAYLRGARSEMRARTRATRVTTTTRARQISWEARQARSRSTGRRPSRTSPRVPAPRREWEEWKPEGRRALAARLAVRQGIRGARGSSSSSSAAGGRGQGGPRAWTPHRRSARRRRGGASARGASGRPTPRPHGAQQLHGVRGGRGGRGDGDGGGRAAVGEVSTCLGVPASEAEGGSFFFSVAAAVGGRAASPEGSASARRNFAPVAAQTASPRRGASAEGRRRATELLWAAARRAPRCS